MDPIEPCLPAPIRNLSSTVYVKLPVFGSSRVPAPCYELEIGRECQGHGNRVAEDVLQGGRFCWSLCKVVIFETQ